DTEDNLDLLEFALKRKPLTMLRASSGKACLQVATETSPDVILLDIQMPEMDGYETLSHLRANPVTAKIPVIFLTAQRKDPASIEKGLMLGADEYLTKPIDTDELLVRTRTLVRLKRIEAELERTKADFMAMLVHDLRSPLAGIKDVIEFIRELETNKEPMVEDHFVLLRASQESAERMLQLINDLLDVSKYEAGKISLQKETAPIVPIIQRVCKQMEFQYRQKQIELVTDLPADLPKVTIDPPKVAQVFMNLLSNALKFTPSNGKVSITVRRSRERLEGELEPKEVLHVTVKDSGVGIPAEELPTLFERYKQATSARKTRQKGTGLGLTICRLIVEAHGGRITAESEVGKSTAFHFSVPVS
ncbi:MAG: hybrid sensor histidine kinase/response regulator, partial [Proteobacteria bacterium]|nr:hybrid sensor histidine kinase/response regulator [Pseudomonadota bacterium]